MDSLMRDWIRVDHHFCCLWMAEMDDGKGESDNHVDSGANCGPVQRRRDVQVEVKSGGMDG